MASGLAAEARAGVGARKWAEFLLNPLLNFANYVGSARWECSAPTAVRLGCKRLQNEVRFCGLRRHATTSECTRMGVCKLTSGDRVSREGSPYFFAHRHSTVRRRSAELHHFFLTAHRSYFSVSFIYSSERASQNLSNLA